MNHLITAEVRPIGGKPGIDLTAFAARIVPVAGCSCPVPCDRAGYEHASQRCQACFDRLIDRVDATLARLQAVDPVVEEHRPTFADVAIISAVAEAEWAGFSLGCNGESVAGPAHYSAEELAAFQTGHAAGFKAYEEAEYDEWNTRQEQQAEWSHQEMVEAAGVFAARA